MKLEKIQVSGIPAVIWGEPCGRIILAAHGSRSSKTDDCIRILAEEAAGRGYQVLSFDLPRHGERACETGLLMPYECVRDLSVMYAYAGKRAEKISLFGCSMGAYFQLLAFADADIDRVWFLSPVTDMERIIRGMMEACGVTESEFRERVVIENDMETLYYPYYEYVRRHPIVCWPHRTYILRGENDTLSEYPYVRAFADRFGCGLTVQEGGEHWFHTEPELAFFRSWIRKHL